MAKKPVASSLLMFFKLILTMFAVILFISVAEGSRQYSNNNFGIFEPPRDAIPPSQATTPAQIIPHCEKAFGVRLGDTCFGVEQLFNLTTEFFTGLNPNLQCRHLFVGQWLCIDGTLNS